MICRKLLPSIILPVLLLFSQLSFAQDRIVTGRVADSTGNGIAGVTVTAKGTRTATQTLNDGTFRLSVASTVNTLVFSSVGFVTQEVSIAGMNAINISLQASASTLSDLVVVAYGTRRKGDLTGSVTSVSSKDFQKGNIASSEQFLLGKVAGLQITTNGGSAGGGSRIRIRGAASLNASNDP